MLENDTAFRYAGLRLALLAEYGGLVYRSRAEIADKGKKQYRFKILGSGPLKDKLEMMAKDRGCKNVDFLGYVAHPLMSAYLVKSDILINSYAKGAPQSIANKIGDYLAASKPMINTLENDEMRKLVHDYGFGVNVPAENPEALGKAIEDLKDGNTVMEEKARKLAEEKFNIRTSYHEIVCLMERYNTRSKR